MQDELEMHGIVLEHDITKDSGKIFFSEVK